MLVFRFKRRNIIKTKKSFPKNLITWCMIHVLIMGTGPLFSLIFNVRSVTSMWMSFIIHFSGASAAIGIVLFIYFYLNIIHTYNKKMRNIKVLCIGNKGIILICVGISEIIVFISTSFLYHYFGVPANILFWGSVLFSVLTLIPTFSFIGVFLYLKIVKMESERYAKLAKQLLITILLCVSISISTSAISIYCMIQTTIEWFLISLTFFFNILLTFYMFYILIKKQSKKSITTSSGTIISETISDTDIVK